MAAVKRTLFRFRLGDEDDGDEGDDEPVSIAVDEDGESEGTTLPVLWIGLAVASIAGLAASGYKLLQHWRSGREAQTEEPWRVEADTSRLPDDSGTASLVGLGFVAGVSALGRRLERDDEE